MGNSGKCKVVNKKEGVLAVRFMAQTHGMYKLSMSVDGEEINGGPLELDFTQPRQEQTRSDYTPASQNNHNHSTSVSRSQQNESYSCRSRFQSGNSGGSSEYGTKIITQNGIHSVTL